MASKKATRREMRRAKRETSNIPLIQDYIPRRCIEPLSPRTKTQSTYMEHILSKDLTLGLGPAGTGKTYVSVALACEALTRGEIDKIVVTRPVLSAEEDLGALPGDMYEKFLPYFMPVKEVLDERLSPGHVKGLMESGRIEIAPLAFMRGRTFKNSWVILDEAQNTTPGQMKLFLTRMGKGAKAIVNGDLGQCDLPGDLDSGLEDIANRVWEWPEIGCVEFDESECVRSKLAKLMLKAYK